MGKKGKIDLLDLKLRKLGVKFIDSSAYGIAFAVDDERKGVVIVDDAGQCIGIRKDEILKIIKDLKDVYDVFLDKSL